jgi:hypothetical protein
LELVLVLLALLVVLVILFLTSGKTGFDGVLTGFREGCFLLLKTEKEKL